MTNLKKSLALFLAVIMMFASLSVAGIAADSNEYQYTVETYFMDTFGVYPSEPDEETSFTAAAGETVVLNADDIEGFTFDSSVSVVEFMVNSDGSSVGKLYYSRNKYTATYIYEDLLGPQTEESSVYYGAEIPGFEANPSGIPSKQGYNFIMWSLDENEKTSVPVTMPAYDIEMYPIYEAKKYTYTFDADDGGYFSNGEQTLVYEYFYGDVPEIPENPEMPHKEFIDWDITIPSTVTSSETFVAMYNDLSYCAIFMDGEEEIGYLDGYFYGDEIEEADIPEGYDAWTLADGTYVEFPYTVTGDVIFYSASLPSEYTVRFYLNIEDSEPYEEFAVLQGDEIDFPADPEKTGYTFIGWSSDITVMPDEDVDFIAEWEANSYTISFDTDGGSFIDDITFDYGSVVTGPVIPTKEGYVFAGWEPQLPEIMPAEDITVTAHWEKCLSEDYLSIKTEIYRQDEATGEWLVADKVERGETVKARIFIETGFAVGTGQVLVFFDDAVFTSDSSTIKNLVINPDNASITGQNRVSGTYVISKKDHPTFVDLVDFGYISQDFLDTHTPISFNFSFTDYKCHTINGDEWFAEFELTAKDDAVGTGDFFVVPETIVNSEEGYYAYIDFTRGAEGDSSLSAENMLSWNAQATVESKPVSTGYGRIIFDANGGTFASTGNDSMTTDYVVGEAVSVSEYPELVGYNLSAWEPQLPETMTEEIITVEAQWTPSTNTPFTIKLFYYDFLDNGEVELKHKLIPFSGTTGYNIKFSQNPYTGTINNGLFISYSEDLKPHIPEYNYISDIEKYNDRGYKIAADGSTVINILCDKSKHKVRLHPGAGDIQGVDVGYYGEAIIYVPHGEYLKDHIPDNIAVRAGYDFVGWDFDPDLRVYEDIETMIDAIWDAREYTINFYWYGRLVETVTADCGTEYPIPGSYEDGWGVYFWFNYENDEDHYNGKIPPYNANYGVAAHPNDHYIYYDAGEGTFPSGKSIVKVFIRYDDIVAEQEVPEDPVRRGYVFAGWDKELPERMPDEDITLNAVWIPEETTTEPTTEQTTFESTTKEETEPSTTEPVTEPSTTVPITEPSTTEPVTEPATQSTTESTTKPVTEPTTKPTTVHTHSLKTVVENANCDKEGKSYQVCNDCGKTVGTATVIPALGHATGDWQTVIEPTHEKEGKKVKKCTRNGCGKILEEAVIPVLERETVDLTIKKPSRTTINYGDSIYLHSVVELPAGAKVVWEASNSNFTYSTSADGKTCLISPASNGETEFTAKVVDKDGNIISEIRTQRMTSKAGFFQKIIAFFKKLFGLTKVFPDFVKIEYDK